MAGRPAFRVRRAETPLRGRLVAARDKSITHRAILLGALADGESRIEAPLAASADVARTVAAAERLGATVTLDGDALLVRGPVRRESAPWDLDAGASGTTARLLLGVLAGLGEACRLDGDPGLRRRPMARVTRRLVAMGARFSGPADALPIELLPGGSLAGVDHELEVASAQVASACLLAGLFASGTTRVTVPGPCRDHTERMFASFSIPVRRDGRTSAVEGPVAPSPARLRVPVDLSSALYPAVLSLLVPDSELLLEEVGVNPTRTGGLDVLARMGADVGTEAPRRFGEEPVADLRVRASRLVGVDVGPELFPRLLDDVPILAVAAAAAEGTTTFRGVGELRVKESDRVDSIAAMLRAFGGRVETTDDTLVVRGGARLSAGRVDARDDHRIAMAAVILAAVAPGTSRVTGVDVTAQSYPGFAAAMRGAGLDVEEVSDDGAAPAPRRRRGGGRAGP